MPHFQQASKTPSSRSPQLGHCHMGFTLLHGGGGRQSPASGSPTSLRPWPAWLSAGRTGGGAGSEAAIFASGTPSARSTPTAMMPSPSGFMCTPSPVSQLPFWSAGFCFKAVRNMPCRSTSWHFFSAAICFSASTYITSRLLPSVAGVLLDHRGRQQDDLDAGLLRRIDHLADVLLVGRQDLLVVRASSAGATRR